MCGYREPRIPGQLFLHRLNDVMRHEWLTIVFSDVSVRDEAGFAAQVAGELSAVVVLHDDAVPRRLENVKDRVAMQRHEPADLELIGRNALLGEDLAGLLNHSL